MHGTNDLTEYDRKEIQNYLSKVTNEHSIVILAHNSIEIEVLTFFLKNIHLAPKLTIYTFQSFDKIPKKLKESILYLVELGAKFNSFEFKGDRILRPYFIECWKEIIKKTDLVVSFYDNKKYKVIIPIDIAKELGKEAMIYNLPGDNLIKHKHKMEHKVRIL